MRLLPVTLLPLTDRNHDTGIITAQTQPQLHNRKMCDLHSKRPKNLLSNARGARFYAARTRRGRVRLPARARAADAIPSKECLAR